MYTIDTTTFFHFIASLLGLAGGALTLDPNAFRSVPNTGGATLLTLMILFLAGVSETLGQSAVLFANKVTPRRFVMSLGLSGAVFIFGVLISICTIWLIGTFIFHADQPIIGIMREVSLGYAPLLFGFFVLLPYMGTFVEHVLEIWSLLAIIVAVIVTLHLHFWQALVCTLLGWVIVQAAKYFLGRLVLIRQYRMTGVSRVVRTHEFIKMLNEEITGGPPGEAR
jgi:hypothetical protein